MSQEDKSQVIPFLRVASAPKAVEWYAQLGFTQQFQHQFEPDFPLFVCIANGRMRLFLSEHTGDARPDTLIYLSVMNIEEFVKGIEGGLEIEEAPWGKEAEVKDLDGNRIRIGEAKD